MFISKKQYENRAAAAWAGVMIGDALGAPAEFCYREYLIYK